MNWPERRPGYLPPAAWERAHELRESPATSKAEAAALVRLIGPDMAATWRGLAARGVSDPTSWRLLLELFVTSTPGPGFDRDLRAGLTRARALLPKIAKRAGELAELVAELAELRNKQALAVPLELTETLSLLELAGYREPPREPGPLMSDSEEALSAIELPALFEAMSEAAELAEVAPGMPHQAYVAKQKPAITPEWVRAIDGRFRLYYAGSIQPRGLKLTDADLTHVCKAVIGQEVSERAANKYRADAPAPLQSDSVILYRSPPE